MEYAINTSFEVIHAGRYYAVHEGRVVRRRMFPSARGPSPTSSLLKYIPSLPAIRSTMIVSFMSMARRQTSFIVGYTPGYLGAFVWDDTVVFGTGWWYPGWIGADYWYGWPWTWGFGFDFGYFGGGWFWRPGGYWWYHNPGYFGRVYSGHWNPHWAPGDRERIHNNVNVYNRWGGNAVMPRSSAHPTVPERANSRDIYAGRDGSVYERQNNSWMQRSNSGASRRVQPAPDVLRQQQSRSLGESREREFGEGGFSRGFPRSMSGGFGGFRGGRR